LVMSAMIGILVILSLKKGQRGRHSHSAMGCAA
jgi:hypothetical protein